MRSDCDDFLQDSRQEPEMMQLGPKGTTLIQSFEKLMLTGYPDATGIPTAGWGHTGPDVAIGVTYTLDQCNDWFRADTAHACAAINRDVTVPLTQDQFDALVSLAFNIGTGAFGASTLLRLLNQGDTAGAADQFLVWDKIGGWPSAGLLRRRTAERALFLTPA
jgi:lysozyme